MSTNGASYKVKVVVNKRANGLIAKRARAYLMAVEKSQGVRVPTVEKPAFPRLEALERVAHIPIVESGIEVTEKIYTRIRESNSLIRWYLTLGEKSLATGVQLALPAVSLLETPIHQLDKFLCKSLDVVEKRVPSVHLPQALYSETRRYVLRRADSVKQIGSAVLDSRVTAATATALDRALTTADMYVDKYLPPDYQDAAEVMIIVSAADADDSKGNSGRACAVHAVQHGARLGKKLQRRLTRQALAEAKAIKEQINVLVYVAELVATDPQLAWKKAKQLYASLSQPEPENQARPATLEELMVLLSRETARKVVHFINFIDLQKNLHVGLALVSSHLAAAAETLLKAVSIDSALTEIRVWRRKLTTLLQQLQDTSKVYLEHLAMFLAGNDEREKITPRSLYEQRDDLATINGLN